MSQHTELQQKKFNMLKAYRTAIRLKHSLEADTEINETIYAVEAKIDAALAAGKPLELDPGEVFGAV